MRIGLVSRVVPAGRALPEAIAMARSIADRAPLAVREAKGLINAAADLPIDAGLALDPGDRSLRLNLRRALTALCTTLYQRGEFAKSRDYHQRALDVRIKLNDPLGQGHSYLQLCALAGVEDDPTRELALLNSAYHAFVRAADTSGQLDCTILSIPNTYTAAEKGFVKIITQKENVARDYPTHIIYGQEAFIAKNPNTIKAFLRATSRAFDWVKANRDEAASILTKQVKYKLDHSRKSIDEVADEWYSDGRLPREQEGMKAFWSIAVQIGDVKEPWPNSRWLDDTFIKTQNDWRK
jgi:tetratricopeptide (TPR) repeat protein